ncbi:MAG TPA: hypothetical protein VMU54_19660 [Planctomycetota bacterium]|nr:hypothetical protein [Planctomycetota bacterium]
MKGIAWMAMSGLAAALVAAGNPDSKSDLKAAAKKLKDAGGYSWTSTSKNAGGGGGGANRPQVGPTEGKVDKDGVVWIKITRGDNATEAYLKAGKSAIKTADAWKAGSELQGDPAGGQARPRDPAAGLARRLQNFKAPAIEADELVDKVGELKDEGDGVFSGALTEEGAKALMTFGGRPGGNGPQVSDPKGTAKFWVKDGTLAKYEINTQGKITFNNNDREINRTTTVEFKDTGSTKIDVPDEAKKLLE